CSPDRSRRAQGRGPALLGPADPAGLGAGTGFRRFAPCAGPDARLNPRSTECGRSSGVEHNLAKVRVVSSNLIARSSRKGRPCGRPFALAGLARTGPRVYQPQETSRRQAMRRAEISRKTAETAITVAVNL